MQRGKNLAARPDTWARCGLAVLYGLVCHSLFALAVGTMILAMFHGMTEAHGTVPQRFAPFANAGLLAQFVLVHSLLLMQRSTGALSALAPRFLGKAMTSTSYVIVASFQTFLLFYFWTPSGIIWWRAEGLVAWLVTGLYIGSWLLLARAIWDAGLSLQTGFLGWWAVFTARKPVFPSMPTAGLFRFVRQPIYVAFALTLWTTPTWTPDQLAVAVTLTSYCLLGPVMKERRFKRRYGESFETYSRSVPYWLPILRRRRRRNIQSIYGASAAWWGNDVRWVRVLRNMVPVRLAFFDPLVGSWDRKRVLDLGCGGGFMSEALATKGAIVTGIDPSTDAVFEAGRHSKANRLQIDYLVARGEHLPFKDSVFDVVVCVDVLEHVDDLEGVIGQIGRVLKPGGIFFFDTINRTPLATFVIVMLGERILRLLPPGTHDPSMFIRPARLRRTLTANRFEVGKFVGFGPTGITRKLDLTFGRLPITAVQYLGHAVRE